MTSLCNVKILSSLLNEQCGKDSVFLPDCYDVAGVWSRCELQEHLWTGEHYKPQPSNLYSSLNYSRSLNLSALHFKTPLMEACNNGYWEVVQTLLLYKCNVCVYV